jgi:hypothetical protein
MAILIFYPDPFNINNTNGANYNMNLNVAANTTYTPTTSTFLQAPVADGWNGIDTIITLACSGRANNNYHNESRIILDGSYNTNNSKGYYGSTILFQNNSASGFKTNMLLEVISDIALLNVNGNLTVQRDITLYGNIRLYANQSTGSSGTFSTDGYVICNMYSISNSGTDLLGTYNVASVNANNPQKMIYIMFNTFTGFHRVFTEDIEFDKENPQKFKEDYVGRIVISTGKIATDIKDNNDNTSEWEIKYDKDGITIEDALPMIELSRTSFWSYGNA